MTAARLELRIDSITAGMEQTMQAIRQWSPAEYYVKVYGETTNDVMLARMKEAERRGFEIQTDTDMMRRHLESHGVEVTVPTP